MLTTITEERVARWREEGLSFLEDVLTLPSGSSYGGSLDPWQRRDFRAAFTTDKHVWWERPRGHSKTTDAAALSLHHQLSGPGRRIYFAATDKDQASLAHDSLRGFVNRSPLLHALRVDRWRVSAPSTDSTLEVLSADAASSWGLRPSLVVVDELQAWRGDAAEELFWSLFSALGKIPNARMLICTTAGWDRTSLCWKLREQIQGDPGWEFSRWGQVASWVSPEFLAQQKRILPEHVYRRLHDNEWTDAGGAYLTHAEVQGMFAAGLSRVPECYQGCHYLGLDLGVSHDASVASVLHFDDDGVTVHDIQSWSGSKADRVRLEDVESWVEDAARNRYSQVTVVADPWQAVGLVQRLVERGIRAEEVTFTQAYRNRLFSNVLELVRGRRLRCYPHESLKDELLRLEFREVGGNLRVDHPAGAHDDHAVSVAMAALAACIAGQGMELQPILSERDLDMLDDLEEKRLAGDGEPLHLGGYGPF